jgi:hypothetical protein
MKQINKKYFMEQITAIKKEQNFRTQTKLKLQGNEKI